MTNHGLLKYTAWYSVFKLHYMFTGASYTIWMLKPILWESGGVIFWITNWDTNWPFFMGIWPFSPLFFTDMVELLSTRKNMQQILFFKIRGRKSWKSWKKSENLRKIHKNGRFGCVFCIWFRKWLRQPPKVLVSATRLCTKRQWTYGAISRQNTRPCNLVGHGKKKLK